jgi:hypothetical protein
MEYCIVYLSSSKGLYSEADLSHILTKSRSNNPALGITGVLVYLNGSIIQVLEGPEQNVQALYKTISRDPRHGQVITLFAGPVEKRSFEAWSMGYKTLGTRQLDHLKELQGRSGGPDSDNVVTELVRIFYQNNYRN